MAEIVLRVRLIGGEHVDVTYKEADTADSDVVVLYGRGVAAVEVAPRGAVV
jgi:hypothetical protein